MSQLLPPPSPSLSPPPLSAATRSPRAARLSRRRLLRAAGLGAALPLAFRLDPAAVRQALAQATPVATGPLASWRPGFNRDAIVSFINAVIDEAGPDYVPPAERYATFDMDGTLIVSYPMYAEIVFTYDRVHALAPDHPEWRTKDPYRLFLTEDVASLWRIHPQQAAQALAEMHAGLTPEEFEAIVRAWLVSSRHPRFDRPYSELVYQPMLEVIDYFQRHEFTCYIVSGSGQDFIRAFSLGSLGIPPERVVGTAMETTFDVSGPEPRLLLTGDILYVDDHDGKPEGINLIVGHRPQAAFGNSNGDVAMLQYTSAGEGARLMMIVHHDDPIREYAYDIDSDIGTISQATFDLIETNGWHLISMKDDWAAIFPFAEE